MTPRLLGALPTNPGPKWSDDRKGGAGRWLDGGVRGRVFGEQQITGPDFGGSALGLRFVLDTPQFGEQRILFDYRLIPKTRHLEARRAGLNRAADAVRSYSKTNIYTAMVPKA